jgi:hypothetical protein
MLQHSSCVIKGITRICVLSFARDLSCVLWARAQCNDESNIAWWERCDVSWKVTCKGREGFLPEGVQVQITQEIGTEVSPTSKETFKRGKDDI